MNKYLALLAVVITSVVFSGCVASLPKTSYTNDSPSYKNVYTPELNTINKAEIGNTMYSKSYMYYPNTMDIVVNEHIIGKYDMLRKIDTRNGFSLPIRGVLSKWEDSNTLCFNNSLCVYDEKGNGYLSQLSDIRHKPLSSKLEKPVKYRIEPSKGILGEYSFKYEVLYQGRTKDKIKISFREFKNNMARSAFTQDIEYQVEKDGTTMIGFKGLRIEVHEATNLDITYKVIKDFK